MSSLNHHKSPTADADKEGASTKDVEYEVLYYERKNKVHKSKGVSKFDGVLTVTVATGAIRLKDATAAEEEDDDAECSEDEEEQKMRGKAKKKKMRKQHQSQRKPVPYNGSDRALAQKCCALQDDEIIVLGGYEVQIVSSLSKNQTVKSKPNGLLSRHHQRAATVTGGLTRKRPNSTLGSATGNNAAAVGQRRVLSKPLQSSKTKANAALSTNNGTSVGASISARKPLLQSRNPLQQQQQQRKRTVFPSSGGGPFQSRAKTSVGGGLQMKRQQTSSIVNKENHATTSCTTPKNIAVCAEIPMPASLRTALRPHQVEGVEFLWKALAEGPHKGAILADEMGLGKTLMTITVLCGMFRKQRDKHFIVVCPSSLVSNWAKEFDKWVGKTSQPKRVVIQKGDADNISRLKSVYSSTKSMGGQVLILSYELFRRVTEHFTHNISLLVVDEGHRLKNQDGLTVNALESLPCDAKLCITATPVQNNLREFYNLANFVRPNVLGDLASFRKTYEHPISALNRKNASREQKLLGKERSKALDALIKPFMLRRLQKHVLKTMLPPRTEALLFCQPTPTQRQMYGKLCRNATSLGMSTEALTMLTNLRKLCSHPFLVSQKKGGNGAFPAGEDYVSLSGKLIVLQSLLHSIREQGDKVVIVSNFTSALSLIESAILQPQQLPFCRLDGSTDQSDRQALVDTFNRANSSVFAFLLSSKAGGCGLNLIGANRLIMYDADWNPATDSQATARIYRPGQTKPCYIYRMFTTGTVEEVILQRQIAKGSLAVFDNTKSNEKFTKEELADCFTLKDCKCDTKRKLGKTWFEYEGPESLETQGCNDEPLSHVAEQQSSSNVLSFVHIVQEKEDEATANSAAMPPMDDNSDDDSDDEATMSEIEESSEEEEMKFSSCRRPTRCDFIDDEAAEASDDEEPSDAEIEPPVRKRPAKRSIDGDESSDEEMEF